MDRNAEFKFLEAYAAQSCLDEEICRDRLRMLWTAYCLHHGLDVDTAGYDNDLMMLWKEVSEVDADTSDWADFDSFDGFMCKYLV